MYAIAHVLLPTRHEGDTASPDSRFADTVVDHLIGRLGPDVRTRELVAYVAGGASMFDATDGVGAANVEQLMQSVEDHRLRTLGEDLGGSEPRQLIVHGPTRRVVSLRLDPGEDHPIWEMPQSFGGVPSLLDKGDLREPA